MTVWRAKQNPWDVIDYNEDVTYAVRAIAAGVANAAQQRLFWEWFQFATGKDDISFRPGPDGAIATAFAEGKRFLGQQVAKHLSPLMTPKAMNAPPVEKPKKRGKKK
jgi:hypothetical protein